ncbi:hypothetical protein RclHR1_00370027 [Rhizophagus clarus]|uniref:Uncharacterized protein n=1 Tax=Rhizophagus clarus TaxID=94130 RepID=A0A2Z6S6U5_9GLOM|nr:hypothetical protein RclHR1_00370027 [Rhizophagus clarus]
MWLTSSSGIKRIFKVSSETLNKLRREFKITHDNSQARPISINVRTRGFPGVPGESEYPDIPDGNEYLVISYESDECTNIISDGSKLNVIPVIPDEIKPIL